MEKTVAQERLKRRRMSVPVDGEEIPGKHNFGWELLEESQCV